MAVNVQLEIDPRLLEEARNVEALLMRPDIHESELWPGDVPEMPLIACAYAAVCELITTTRNSSDLGEQLLALKSAIQIILATRGLDRSGVKSIPGANYEDMNTYLLYWAKTASGNFDLVFTLLHPELA